MPIRNNTDSNEQYGISIFIKLEFKSDFIYLS